MREGYGREDGVHLCSDLIHDLASGAVGLSMYSLSYRFGLKNISLFSKSKQLIGIHGILYFYTGIKQMLVYGRQCPREGDSLVKEDFL